MVMIYKLNKKPDIKAFRFPRWLGMVLLYVTFCFSEVFFFRSDLNGLPFGVGSQLLRYVFDTSRLSLTIHWTIYVLSGLMDWLVFELFAALLGFLIRSSFPFCDAKNMKHILRIFCMFRNVVLALLNIVLFYYPLAIAWMSSLGYFLISTLAMIGFYIYYAHHNLPAYMQGQGLLLVGEVYLVFSFLIYGIAL